MTMPLAPVPGIDALTGGAGTACMSRFAGSSPPAISKTALNRLQQAEKFIKIIEQISQVSQSLEQAWSGSASEAAVQKITSSIGSFMQIVQIMQESAALLTSVGIQISSVQISWNSIMPGINSTVMSLMSNPWTWGAAQALATGSVSSMNTWVSAVEAALHIGGATKMMQQVAVLATIVMDIEQLAQGNGNAAAEASAMIGMYRAGNMGVSSLSSSSSSGLMSGSGLGSSDVLDA